MSVYRDPGHYRRGLNTTVTNDDGVARNDSVNSNNSSNYTQYSDPFQISRSTTLSSTASGDHHYARAGQKRGLTEVNGLINTAITEENSSVGGGSPGDSYRNVRQSLRPLPQAPSASPTQGPKSSSASTIKAHISTSGDLGHASDQFDYIKSSPTVTPNASRSSPPNPSTPTTPKQNIGQKWQEQQIGKGHLPSMMTTPDLKTFQKSTTGHLRTLSKLAENDNNGDFSMRSQTQNVVGLEGRWRLQRSDSTRKGKVPGPLTAGNNYSWSDRNWMDKQRQFLQAYEYLCHIGEAKEWIERVIDKPLPPIIQLEQALRDGVILAEIVQAVYPNQPLRIFRHPKLQFRHSDNIAIFFNFLADIELPELFRFELTDLYEKKNIPKVIYCIHAVSWLLLRHGAVDFRIGNLVGQLEFEHHELEQTQKGLDKAGVSMPSFHGVGANFGASPEPEPEPVETEEERIQRELSDNEASVVDLQAQIRGALERKRLGGLMNSLWDSEHLVVDLQSRIRGDFSRQISGYRLGMKKFATDLQSTSRGFLVRRSLVAREQQWRSKEQQIINLQSRIRGHLARRQVKSLKQHMRSQDPALVQIQSRIRGSLTRQQMLDQCQRFDDQIRQVDALRARIRGTLARAKQAACRSEVQSHNSSVTSFQSRARAAIKRQQYESNAKVLRQNTESWTALQSLSRGHLARAVLARQKQNLQESQSQSSNELQARVKGALVRKEIAKTKTALDKTTPSVVRWQAAIRGYMARERIETDKLQLLEQKRTIVKFQAFSRGLIAREQQSNLLAELDLHSGEVASFQALSRAMLLRGKITKDLAALDDGEASIIDLQSRARGALQRAKYAEKQKFFKKNMEKVVKIQSFVRGKIQGQAYKSLTSGENPPVGTVKNFVHLLNDSDFDFDEEIEFERLRKTVVQQVRQNEHAEQYIDQIDIKIALLVKNKITLDEVVKHQRHFGGHMGNLLTNADLASKDPFDLKALNKNSRKKLEHYQQLFFILQTQPQYLARLFRRMRTQAVPEKECKRIETLMMGLFGYAQKRREEYYLLKLISRSVREEVDACTSVKDYLRGNFFWTKLLNGYVRSPKDRKFMRDLLGPLVRENILENAELDLESDPLQIYKASINNEELRTGRQSRRSPDVSQEEAIKDPETRRTFTDNLQDLRDIADSFIGSLEENLHKMPFGIRFISQAIFESLCSRFPSENRQEILRLVGKWVWKTYLQPAVLQPENWGVVDRGMSPIQKRNLGEVAKVLAQVVSGRNFGGENLFLQPLNAFVRDTAGQVATVWENVMTIPNAESYFDIDEFNDLYARNKPTLYIKMTDVFAVHKLVASEIGHICTSKDDVLREVVQELGNVRNNETEMMGVSNSEINLTLNPKLHEAEDPDTQVKSLFMETKRCILYIIRVQTGTDLMNILIKAVGPEEEARWQQLIQEELVAGSKKRGAYSEANPLVDITSLSYSELKGTALENILRLERLGRLTRGNQYQDLLNSIAVDIRTKHRRRIQRQRELESVKLTMANLHEKAVWLEQQLKSYNNYIEQAMLTLQNKKGKKRFLLPFTKQYNHEKELQRSGRVPKFGSFKYSARALVEKGVLVYYQGYNERQYEKINITIASDEVGVFFIEASTGSIQIPGASAQVPLDDLLQAQFNNQQFVNLFEDSLRLNVNLLLHLVFKKFYRDE